VLGNLITHPERKQAKNHHALKLAEEDVKKNLVKLEVLKPRINRKYERYEQLVRDRDARRASASTNEGSRPLEKITPALQINHKRLLSDPAVAHNTETLAAEDHRDLAVDLAHKEIRRRATARKATRQAGISEEVEQQRRTAGLWGNWEEAFTNDDEGIDQDTLSQRMQNVRSQVNGSTKGEARNTRTLSSRPSFESQRSNYRYPVISGHRDHDELSRASPSSSSFMDDFSPQRTPLSSLPPELPPKDSGQEGQRYEDSPPPRPDKGELSPYRRALNDAKPSPLEDPKKNAYVFQPSAYLENGIPLRSIFLPQNLRHRFLSVAQANTRANLETCGILCGTLVSNALFISRLVIPDQESTSDTCETVNESELFDYVDGEDLMVLGWIHTHPTQTCFMSSRDLHTHGGYQVMMPESIAIVCAPSKGDWGVFRLTDPPGMKTVLNCAQTGLFHPHAESHIYTEALRPGHVVEVDGLKFEVVDLRPN